MKTRREEREYEGGSLKYRPARPKDLTIKLHMHGSRDSPYQARIQDGGGRTVQTKMNVGTKGKSPKQGLPSAQVLTIMQLEGEQKDRKSKRITSDQYEIQK